MPIGHVCNVSLHHLQRLSWELGALIKKIENAFAKIEALLDRALVVSAAPSTPSVMA
jgi:hypothetical protein